MPNTNSLIDVHMCDTEVESDRPVESDRSKAFADIRFSPTSKAQLSDMRSLSTMQLIRQIWSVLYGTNTSYNLATNHSERATQQNKVGKFHRFGGLDYVPFLGLVRFYEIFARRMWHGTKHGSAVMIVLFPITLPMHIVRIVANFSKGLLTTVGTMLAAIPLLIVHPIVRKSHLRESVVERSEGLDKEALLEADSLGEMKDRLSPSGKKISPRYYSSLNENLEEGSLYNAFSSLMSKQ